MLNGIMFALGFAVAMVVIYCAAGIGIGFAKYRQGVRIRKAIVERNRIYGKEDRAH